MSASLAKSQTTTTADVGGIQLPDNTTMQYATKLAIINDKPLMIDYWTSSIEQTSLIGIKNCEDGTNEKLLVKSSDEYTSPIVKIYKISNEYIVETENSIYIVDSGIPTKRIST